MPAKKFVYQAPEGSTLEVDGKTYKANEPFTLAADRAAQVRREIPEVVEHTEPQKEARQAQAQTRPTAEAEPADEQEATRQAEETPSGVSPESFPA